MEYAHKTKKAIVSITSNVIIDDTTSHLIFLDKIYKNCSNLIVSDELWPIQK